MFALAAPVVIAELGWMTMGMVDTLMVGPLGPEAIGAVGLGSSLSTAVAIFAMGMLLGLDHARLAVVRRRAPRRVPPLAAARRLSRPGSRHSIDSWRLPSRRQPRSLAHECGRAAADPSLPGGGGLEPAAVAALLRLPALSAGRWRGAAHHAHAHRRESVERGRQLDADLRPSRSAGTRGCGCRLGDGVVASRHGRLAARGHRVARAPVGRHGSSRPVAARAAADSQAGRSGVPGGDAADAGSRRVRGGVGARRADAAGVARRSPDRAEPRGVHVHGAARHRLRGSGARRPRRRARRSRRRGPCRLDRAGAWRALHERRRARLHPDPAPADLPRSPRMPGCSIWA